MSFEIKGYVFEPPRVGTANSPYTMTPDNVIVDPGAYAADYPDGSEPNPRVEYMALVMDDGLLVDASFGFTKNEVVARFDFDGSLQRYRTLPGGPLLAVGVIGPDLNTDRLKVPTPTAITGIVAPAPWRLSVGTGSGVTFPSTLVSSFGAPAPGTVEILSTTGELNWNPADLATYDGQDIRFQRQAFFGYNESNGKIGLSSDVLLLCPLPAAGQFPLVRLGFGQWLTPVERANEGALADPAVGTVEWAADTGRLKFHSADVALAKPVYYDGVLMAWKLLLPWVAVGTVAAPTDFPNQALGEDLIFQLATGEQFPSFQYVTAFDPVGKKGVVQLLQGATTSIQFSAADQGTFGATAVTLVYGDLFIERGFSLRLFRTPVNLTGTGTTKDVSSVYPVVGATYANPIIGSPEVFLPQVPRDDGSLAVSVAQGTGTFTPGVLPILDGSIPLPGGPGPTYGYVLDYDQKKLRYAFRKNDVMTTFLEPTGALVLPDPLVQSGALELELETGPGTNVFIPLVLGEDALYDGNAQVTFIQKAGSIVASGTGAFVGTALVDPAGDFTGVLPGDTLVVLGAVYTVATVLSAQSLTTDYPAPAPGVVPYEIHQGKETMADRYFAPVELVDPATKVERILSLGPISNAPRLMVPLQWVGLFRIRFGTQPTSPYSTSVTSVANDGAFTAPAGLSQGAVEVSLTTGNLNFSSADITIGSTVFWARTLKIKRDYTITAPLGFINFTERFLAYEEVLLTYQSIDQDTGLSIPVVEPGVFIVRKELCQPHPNPTSILYFNTTNRVIAATPAPAVFRGGRPQDIGVQCTVNLTNSSITFLADQQITDALPHGATIDPVENVYVDYYITQALGGEQSLTVQLPPMAIAQVTLAQDAPNFLVTGDHTATFLAGYLLRVENIEVHLIDTATYDGGLNQTTVALVAGDLFQDDYNNNPQLYETSGPTRTVPQGFYPSYFPSEAIPYTTVPRGMNKVVLEGDRLAAYRTGSVIRFTDGLATFQHFYLLTSAELDRNGQTVLTLASNTRQQYDSGTHFLSYSLHPILEDGATTTSTSKVPVLTEPTTVFRRVEGQVGQTLALKTDYTIDESGVVTYRPPLVPSEEISIFYTGHVIKQAGVRLKSSYTALTVPSSQNGLLNQVLLADYTLDSPDTFYWRIETMTNFLAEIALQLQQSIQSTVPSGGPVTSNSAGGPLYTKGRPSLYFDEKHIANQDIVSRKSLYWYNTTLNLLEDALQDLDGRVVGNHSGRFLFDMTQGVVHDLPADVTNQIDDRFKVSPAPYEITFGGGVFTVTSIGTYQAMYLPAPTSRFYPTEMPSFGVTSTGVETGDAVYDTGHRNLTNVSDVHTRLAWAIVTKDAAAGATTLYVDTATGSETLARPLFVATMKCVIQKQDGTFVHNEGAPVTVGAVIDQKTLAITALAAAVPAGSTIYRSPSDDSVQVDPFKLTYYQPGRDYGFNPDGGTITYVKPYPPYDGSNPLVPVPLRAVPLVPLQPLVAYAAFNNVATAPTKFPALYGGTQDDSGDTSFPVLTPSPVCEFVEVGDPLLTSFGLLDDQDDSLTTIPTITTTPYLGVGSLNGAKTIITDVLPAFPAPVPRVGDLVRIYSGLNGVTEFRRIVAVGGNTIQIPAAFANVDAGFQYLVAVSASAIGTANGIIGATTTFTDPSTDFQVNGTRIGYTVVITQPGANLYARRQVTAITGVNTITVDAAFPALQNPVSYRIDDSLATYGGPGSLLDPLSQDLSDLLALYTTQVPPLPTPEMVALEDFFEQVFTDIIPARTGDANGTSLTDLTVDFLTSGVLAGQVVYIRQGAAKGVYKIQTVAQHVLTVDPAMAPDPAPIYRVDQVFAVSFRALQDVFAVLASIDDFITPTQTFETLATTPFPVVKVGPVPDPTVFARGFYGPEFAAQQALVGTRQGNVPLYASSISNVMGGSDRLYDARYTWIDARINLKTGTFVNQQRAVVARMQAQADITNQLFKLLSVSA